MKLDRRTNGQLLLGVLMVASLVVVGLGAPLLAPFDPLKAVADSFGSPFAPRPPFLLGTDEIGRDILSRLIYGARLSLTIAVAATSITVVIGVVIGTAAGFFGGQIDGLLMRATDVVLSFPLLLLAIALAAVAEPGLRSLLLVIALVGWTGVARTVRAEVLSLKEREFVSAARAMGATSWRVVARHILPNAVRTIAVMAALSTCNTLLLDAGLSFLGLGIPAPAPSWGRMLSDSEAYYRVAPWLMFFPGVAIVYAVAAFNLLGYGLAALGERSSTS
ncbi:MAG TPA: ABC transporter permease [Candidatus Acidoferrales bacterium]|nr:ABC transporter permease [Candidatus Acidoferrales bacterium]